MTQSEAMAVLQAKRERDDLQAELTQLRAQLAAKDEEIARLQKVIRVLRTALAIGQVVGGSKDALEKELSALKQAQGEKG